MRRVIPSRSALLAFEAAARYQSFTSAAAELSLSESAISRQIASLEEQLGLKLFNRIKKRVVLTKAGLLYSQQIRESLDQIEHDMFNIMAHGGTREILELAILPTFCSQWLIPRISSFYQLHPDMRINISARSDMFLFKDTNFDAAIHFGQPTWPGTVAEYLFKEQVIAVCNPGLLEHDCFHRAEEILNYPLLHLTSRPDAWRNWFHKMELSGINAMQGSRYEHFSILISAACAGLGIALIPQFLISNELARKELTVVFDYPLQSRGAYYLVTPEDNISNSALQSFKEWILTEADDTGDLRQKAHP
jgi:DNA-binding transcriptional LysR family regulator